jgi:hypothetical protein
MSLINQVLRDLAQRNSSAEPTDLALSIQVVGQEPARRNKHTFIWLLGVLLLGYVIWLLYPLNTMQISKREEKEYEIKSLPLNWQQAPSQWQPLDQLQPLAPLKIEASPILPSNNSQEQPEKAQAEVKKPRESRPQAPKNLLLNTENLAKPENKSVKPVEKTASLCGSAKDTAAMQDCRAHLEEILLKDPRSLPTRLQLLTILLKLHVADFELIQLLDEGLSYFPHNLVFLKNRAQIEMQQKNFARVVSLLVQEPVDKIADSDYLALLAAAYVKLQVYAEAIDIYQRLTQLQPNKAENWLGLALTADKLNQTGVAKNAYQYALEKNTLQFDVMNYIKQRLQNLN